MAMGVIGVKPAARKPDRKTSVRFGQNRDLGAAEADGRVMAAVAKGDREAFAGVVDRELQRIQAVARRVLGNESDAEDVAQEALLKLWQQADNWRPGEAQIRTWLYRVAVNLSIDRLRRRREEGEDAAPERDPGSRSAAADRRARLGASHGSRAASLARATAHRACLVSL